MNTMYSNIGLKEKQNSQTEQGPHLKRYILALSGHKQIPLFALSLLI